MMVAIITVDVVGERHHHTEALENSKPVKQSEDLKDKGDKPLKDNLKQRCELRKVWKNLTDHYLYSVHTTTKQKRKDDTLKSDVKE